MTKYISDCWAGNENWTMSVYCLLFISDISLLKMILILMFWIPGYFLQHLCCFSIMITQSFQYLYIRQNKSHYIFVFLHHPLILTTEECLTASALLPLVLVEKLVEISPVLLLCTVLVIPPVTHKILLGEDGSIRAEEASGLSAGRAHVEHLAYKS